MADEFINIPDVIAGVPVHAMARDFPSMSHDAFEQLKASLEAHGQKEPVRVWEGYIIDGAHRALALEQLSKTPLINEETCSEADAIKLAFILNAERRHLNTAQKAYAVIEHEKRLALAHASAGVTNGRRKPRKPTRAALAARVGTTPRTVQKVATIDRGAVPDVTEALKRGRISIDQAQNIAGMPINRQYDALQASLASERKPEKRIMSEATATRSWTETFDAFMTLVLDGYQCFDDVRPIMQRNPICFANEIGDMIDIFESIRDEALSVTAHVRAASVATR